MARLALILPLLLVLPFATVFAAEDPVPPKVPEEQVPPETPLPGETTDETPIEPMEEPLPEAPDPETPDGETVPIDEPIAPPGLDEAIDAIDEPTRVPETVVTPARGRRELFDIPKSVTVISSDTIMEHGPTQIVDVLTRRSPGIVMDIRTSTAGDPIMRGWAGFNILTLIDGNTLSTLWGEGGTGADDMYSKVDPDTIERIEVVHGPQSALYGSNALGGVIHFITRSSPIDYVEDGFDVGAREKYTYASAANAHRFRTEVFGATDRFKFLAGWTFTDTDDIEGGRGVGTLTATSGTGSLVDFRGDVRLDHGQELTLTVHDVTWRDTMRHYRPLQENSIDRTAVSATWRAESIAEAFQAVEVRAYYQRKRDEREWNDDPDTVGVDEKADGYAETITYSLDAQASTEIGPGHLLTYGAHASRDEGESADDEQFTKSYPHDLTRTKEADAPDTTWTDYAAYVQDELAVCEMLDLVATLRYDHFIFRSHSTSHYNAGLPQAQRQADFFRSVHGAWTGGLGVTVKPVDEWRFMASYSRGFRQHAPNFGFVQIGSGVLVPNKLLDPVTADNFEVGFRTRYPAVRLEGFGYFSDVDDSQETRPGTFQGSPTYDINGNGVVDPNENVVSVQNARGAYIAGFELSGTVYPSEICGEIPANYSLNGGLAYSYGRTNDGDWFRHTMPLRGLIGLRWDDLDPKRKAFVELQVEMVDRYSRIPEGREDNDLAWERNPQNPAPDDPADPSDDKNGRLRKHGGVPGYTIFSLYGGLNLCDSTRVTMAVENFTDKKYRRAHSRMDAPGVNVVLGIDVSF